MSFSYEVERDGKLSFLDVNVFRELTFIARPFVGFTHISKVFCQQLITFAWFIPLHIDVFEFVLIGQNLTRNSGFLKVSF